MKRNSELRIKIKSLAEEARIIRKDETKAFKAGDYAAGTSLHNHRVTVVRRAARSTLLAYQYLRGVPYAACENHSKTKTSPRWEDVRKMVKKYGDMQFDYKEWVAGKTQPVEEVEEKGFIRRLLTA